MSPKARQVDVAEKLDLVLRIHNEIPLGWDPSFHVAPEHLAKLRADVLADRDSHAFWLLGEEPVGMLWAALRKGVDGRPVCSLMSFWIHPEHRGRNLAPLLTGPCVRWARERGAAKLQCDAHAGNQRMREILEKNGFRMGMIQYVLELPATP
jgi:ribosomal protein S18 acetylase RimI-like enzyme